MEGQNRLREDRILSRPNRKTKSYSEGKSTSLNMAISILVSYPNPYSSWWDKLTTKETQFACHILQRMSDEFRRHNLHILSSVDSIMKPFLLWSAINLTPRLLILVVSGYIEDCENWLEIYESMECPLMINK